MIRATGALLALAVGCANVIDPAEIDLPARSVPLTFANAGVQLSGTLWLPDGAGPFRAVILMGGNWPWRPARPYFDMLRDSFLEKHIAVMYYDRRGEGGSTGDFDRASFEDLADDAIAAVVAARSRNEVSDAGLYGHSMGGWIAGLAASRSSAVAFVITAAGPGVSPLEQTMFARANEDRAAGIAEETVLEMARLRRKIVEYYVARTPESYDVAQSELSVALTRPWYPTAAPWRELAGVGERLPGPSVLAALDERDPDLLRWFRRDGRYDPSPALAKVASPYLALFGEADVIVPLEPSVVALEAAIRLRSLLTVRRYPGADHMLMTRGALEPGYLSDMTNWVSTLPGAESSWAKRRVEVTMEITPELVFP